MIKLNFSIICLLLIFCISKAIANDDCVADVSGYTEAGLKVRKSIFEIKASNVKKVHPSKLIQYGFEDKVTLKNGIEVTYITGGCAHYGYRFVFKGKKIGKVKETEKLARAESLLKMLDVTNLDEKNVLLKALSEAKNISPADQTKNVLPCGDAFCELLDQGDQKIEIGYSFAL